jgi:uncharacterized protein (UPF0332 family)
MENLANNPPSIFITKAEDSLETAQLLIDADKTEASVNRSYYAVFYCVEALLIEVNTFPKTHKGVKLSFDKFFIVTGKFSKEFGLIINDLYNLRADADYDVTIVIEMKEALDALEKAQTFLNATKSYLIENQFM